MTMAQRFRVVAGGGVSSVMGRRQHKDPTNGRQGKSTGRWRVQVVGWVELFGTTLHGPGVANVKKPTISKPQATPGTRTNE
jgi:hypothetical protein